MKILDDGKTEFTIKGVKGKACGPIGEALSKALGKVLEHSETCEAYEPEVVLGPQKLKR